MFACLAALHIWSISSELYESEDLMYFVARGGSRGRSLGTKSGKGVMGGGEDG
jgi:hypothetical protein